MVILRSGTAAWILAIAVSWTALAIAGALFAQVAGGGHVSYFLGSWPAPWGIEYRIDRANAYLALLVGVVAAAVSVYSPRSVFAEIEPGRRYLFYTMYALCLAGLLGISVTGDAFNLFVFLEISSLSSYVLIALGRDRRALMAAYQYLIMGTIGATFYVIGVGMLYLETGTLNLADMAARLARVSEPRPVLAALAFITVGVSLKLALFPLHLWLPNAYAYAPSVVTAFLAATALAPSVFRLPNLLWFKFGILLGRIVSPIVASLLFFVMITPLALVMKACGRDPLRLRFDPSAKSYWIARDALDTSQSSMRNQF